MPHCRSLPRFKTNPDRVANREVLVNILQEIFTTNSREYWLKLLEDYSVPAAPIYEINEVFEDPYVKSTGIILKTKHPKLGEIPQLASPVYINDKRYTNTQHPPLLGEHTIEILKELGYANEEICKLKKEGVIYYPDEMDKIICT